MKSNESDVKLIGEAKVKVTFSVDTVIIKGVEHTGMKGKSMDVTQRMADKLRTHNFINTGSVGVTNE